MNKTAKEVRMQFQEETNEPALIYPVTHGELGFPSSKYQLWLEEKVGHYPPPSSTAEEILKDNAFMNGGNTDSEKGFYKLGFIDGLVRGERTEPPPSLPVKMEGWVSVEDGLPEEEIEYLTYGKGLPVTTFDWVNGKWWSDVYNKEIDQNLITHWQPLPSPPPTSKG